MTEAAHCEVKLHGFRRTQDGVVVSFVVHPAEVPNALALDPLGTRYMLALAAIGDDERQSAMPPAKDYERSQAGKVAYANKDERKQAVTRSVLLARDPQFQAWLVDTGRVMQVSEEIAKRYIRDECGVISRSEIRTSENALRKYLAIETTYDLYRKGYVDAQ